LKWDVLGEVKISGLKKEEESSSFIFKMKGANGRKREKESELFQVIEESGM